MIIQCRNYNEAKLNAINILSDFDSYCNRIEISYDKKEQCFYVVTNDFSIKEYEEIWENGKDD